jgi:predicted nucleic acid-binding protein
LNRFVLDASVAAKWYVDEEHSDTALQLAETGPVWIVPDLFFAEIGNVLWKKVRLGEMEEVDAREAVTLLHRLEIKVYEARSLVESALKLALQFQCTVYDGLYLSAAIMEKCPLVTADRKLYETFSKDVLKKNILWIEDAL